MTIVTLLFNALILVHVATGFVGLAAFWFPVFARKGGRTHVRAGRVYVYCAYVVTLSAVTAAAGRIVSYQVQGIRLADEPDLYGISLFLGYLGLVTFATVRQGIRVLATRRAPETLRTPGHEALAWMHPWPAARPLSRSRWRCGPMSRRSCSGSAPSVSSPAETCSG